MTEISEKRTGDIFTGINIKRERELAGYTQEQFSEMIGIAPKSLSAIERGTVGISMITLRKICTVLSISSDTIVFGDVPQNNVTQITRKLERLTPKQFRIANKMISILLESFSVRDSE